MDDFTAALYLDFCHGSRQIQPWRQLTTGVPAALRERKADQRLAHEVARLQGLEKGFVAPSSLHLFFDMMGKLGKEAIVLADDKLYQVGRWGLERAACSGAGVAYFEHHNPKSLKLQLQKLKSFHRSVVVLTDGWCPHCGRAAPLPAYFTLARKYKGLLLVDDTQALGVLGKIPTRSNPYGMGGGGMLKWYGLQGKDIITICSLAKGFGVPVSVISGSATRMIAFEQQSDTRMHCSPVSAAHVHAALHALAENRIKGDMIRQKLLQNVRLFRKSLSQLGFSTRGSFFPVQTLAGIPLLPPQELYLKLAEKNIQALLLEPHISKAPGVSFCITASHSACQLKRVAGSLAVIRDSVFQMV